MSKKEKILDDMARMAGGAIGTIGNIRGQMKEEIRLRVDEMAMRMDLVPREDFERVEDLLKQARLEQEELRARIEKLESTLTTGKKAS
jgi:BMFP domain-containing protein YqiC